MNNSNNIEKIIYLMQTDESTDAPRDAIKWSKNIFKTRAAEPKQGLLQRIVGVLVQEIKPGTAAFGERSGSVGKVRQMLFEADQNRVDHRVSKNPEDFDVRGQILGRGWENSVVEIGGQKANIDKFGGFVVKGVDMGTHDVSITGEKIEIILKGIELE